MSSYHYLYLLAYLFRIYVSIYININIITIAVVQRNTAKRRREMLEAELILKEELDKFRLWQQSLGAIPTIAKLQEKAETLRQEEMTKAAKVIMMLMMVIIMVMMMIMMMIDDDDDDNDDR